MEKDISFNEDLTVLVGINGSGKTSLFNIINWMLTPSLPELCMTEFQFAALGFEFNDEPYLITCVHDELNFTYTIETPNKRYIPLRISLNTKPGLVLSNAQRELDSSYYTALRPDPDEKDTWALLSTIPQLNVIGVDRQLFTQDERGIYFDSPIAYRERRRLKKINPETPLQRVKTLVNSEYRKRKSAVQNLTTSLKNHLMISSFEGLVTRELLGIEEPQNISLKQVNKAERRVINYFTNYEEGFSEKDMNRVHSFFESLRQIISDHSKDDKNPIDKLLYILNAKQFDKINSLLASFAKFERNVANEMQHIDRFVDALNFFFKDSSKLLKFSDTGELVYQPIDKDGYFYDIERDITYLSSGEQQILVLFSYIAFNSFDGKIFIIDEPELSLHIKWQEDFLRELLSITPKETQLIFATHSPIIANKMREKAIVLLSYNQ